MGRVCWVRGEGCQLLGDEEEGCQLLGDEEEGCQLLGDEEDCQLLGERGEWRGGNGLEWHGVRWEGRIG